MSTDTWIALYSEQERNRTLARRIPAGPKAPRPEPGKISQSHDPSPRMDGRSWLMLIVLSVLWGGSFFFTEIALVDLPPFTLVLGRVAIAAMILWWVVLLRHIVIPHDPKIWLGFLVMGALNNLIPFCLIVWGQTHIASSLAAILNATTPLFTLIIAHLTTDNERLSRRKVIGVLTGFVGVIIVIGLPDAVEARISNMTNIAALAPFAVLLAAVSYGCAGVFGRRFKNSPPILTAAGQTSASSLMLIPLCILIDTPWNLPFPKTETILAVLGIAAFSTALAYILYFQLLKRAGASNLLLVTFLIPVSAILLGVLFLGETLALRQIGGMVVIGLGLAVIDGRLIGRKGNPRKVSA
ncbi:DMT family transporter [Thalassospira sp. A3_1]|uniref:DMT family transporter n=1 Tax=Thalassospira sp. A3_1 TaxID=2821088 RepID=UPI001ADAC585|nr:DMT family transporter [Thalassospira sp. A3_1]MBO9509449.1 DMT family transporter [Thalassospira sp. A3_1]